MSRSLFLVFSIVTTIVLTPVFVTGKEVFVAGIVSSGKKGDCLCVLKSIQVFDLTYDPNSNKKIAETNKHGLFLVNVKPTDEGYFLELRDPKGIYGNENIIGNPTPHKQRKSKKMDSREAVKEWGPDVAKSKILEQMERFFYVKKSFPTKKNWHDATKRLAYEKLSFIEINLTSGVLRLVRGDLEMAKKKLKK